MRKTTLMEQSVLLRFWCLFGASLVTLSCHAHTLNGSQDLTRTRMYIWSSGRRSSSCTRILLTDERWQTLLAVLLCILADMVLAIHALVAPSPTRVCISSDLHLQRSTNRQRTH